MLIFTLLFLAAASVLFVMLYGREPRWQSWFALAIVTLVSWMCSIGSFAIALDNSPSSTADDISLTAKLLVAGFLLYPVIVWMIAKSFERGRNT